MCPLLGSSLLIKLKKKFSEKPSKLMEKNSKLKGKTHFFGIFEILRCEKDCQRKSLVYAC